MSQQKFLVSVVTAVYNTEDYIEEAILSVINQTIGFKKNIQLVLVNDGSADRSGAICRRYARLYPDNIIYLKKHNGGVANARNFGLKYAAGEWVNFMDSDDKWGKCAFAEMLKFIKMHEDVKVIAPRMKFFDARHDYHMLDYKFATTHVVDVEQEPSSIQLHGAQCWYRRDAIGDCRFDPETKISEDAKFFSDIMTKYGQYGVVRDARYYYRRRSAEANQSLIQSQKKDAYFYDHAVTQNFDYYVEKYSNHETGLLKYFQYVFAYELKWRLWAEIDEDLCPNPEEYRERIRGLLSLVDDDAILQSPTLNAEHKYYMLKYKTQKDPQIYLENGVIMTSEHRLSNFRKRALRIDCIEYRGDKMHIFGRLFSFLPKQRLQLFVEENHVRKELTLGDNPNSRLISFDDENSLEAYVFECYLDRNVKTVSFTGKIDDMNEVRFIINLGTFSKLNECKTSFYCSRSRIARLSKSRMSIVCAAATKRRILLRELRYQLSLLRRGLIKLILYRDAYWFLRATSKNKTWVVSDRADMANDNGEALFRYLVQKKPDGVDCYFRLDRKSQDYNRMRKIGRVLRYNSVAAKLRIMLADKLISSHIDNFVFRPFSKKYDKWMAGLYDYDMVFLQHGIIKDDLSRWLIRYAKNLKFFATSTVAEYDSIINGNYLYSGDQVKLSGLARHDRLVGEESKKTLIIIPTWRKGITGKYDLQDGVRLRNEDFYKSAYYQFYDRLINDSRIMAVMRKRGYHGLFVTHPNHLANADDFHSNAVFDVSTRPVKYSKLFASGALMVTDYSSVAFEFAYLNKPVIYSQFDREAFFANHVYTEGYFSYEDDGFGPVCYDYESTVAAIIKAIENDCRQPKEYADRVAKTFAYHDGKNCERIYQAILAIDDPCEK